MNVRAALMGLLSFLGIAATAGTLSLDWTTDKDPVSYRPGEQMLFALQIMDGEHAVAGKTLKWVRTGDDGKTETGEGVTSATAPVIIRTSIAQPGFVHLEVSVFKADGAIEEDANLRQLKFEGGAGVEPAQLAGYQEPADFDAFWQKQKARLDAVPLKAKLSPVAQKKEGFDAYNVQVDCAGGRPASGYLSLPSGAQPKTLNAFVSFHGYGVGGANLSYQPGTLVLDINAHGIENGRDAAYYKALQDGELKGYAFNNTENAKPETAYFNGMMLRVMRSLQYIKSRPEWNGKVLVVSGGSQGGLQCITAAALDRDVTQCNAYKPWCCDLGGIRLNRLRGWRPDYADGLAYYDTATMGKRITCPVTITAGLGDYVCPPSGVSVLFNNIKGPKTIEYIQGATHGYNPPSPKKQILKVP